MHSYSFRTCARPYPSKGAQPRENIYNITLHFLLSVICCSPTFLDAPSCHDGNIYVDHALPCHHFPVVAPLSPPTDHGKHFLVMTHHSSIVSPISQTLSPLVVTITNHSSKALLLFFILSVTTLTNILNLSTICLFHAFPSLHAPHHNNIRSQLHIVSLRSIKLLCHIVSCYQYPYLSNPSIVYMLSVDYFVYQIHCIVSKFVSHPIITCYTLSHY